jgi:multidrug resistance efflux pump
MTKQRTLVIVGLLVAGVAAAVLGLRRSNLVLTGIVTTDETIVSSEIQGRLQELSVAPGDHVKRGQLLGRIAGAEQQADLAYSESLAESAAAVVEQSAADLRFQTDMTAQQVAQAQANLAAAESAVTQAEADAELARTNFERADHLRQQAINSAQDYDQARAANDAAKARAAAQRQQADAARAALGVARAGAAQVAVHQAALTASRQQLAAAASQKDKAGVRVGYTEIHAPVDGIVNVRAALPGEVVNPGQAIVTLIDPANLWIRADIEESYVDRLHLGDKLTVRLPSGAEREATLFFRGVDAAYATQRDVSRTKRDIKTFELRLRCDNGDGSLAVGMTAYVVLPFAH